ncbi:MAG: hypothetical protein AAF394_01435, partial [Planctomycetota bacterium]
IIREEEPPRPSIKLTGSQQLRQVASNRKMDAAKLASFVRGDLDWIVMKTLEKDRGRRYASAHELAADLERHMQQMPVSARPPSILDRSVKFMRRNRTQVVVAGLLLSAFIISAAVLWQTSRARQVRLQAEKETRTSQLAETLQEAAVALGRASNAPMGQSAEWIAVETLRKQLGDLLDEGDAEPAVRKEAVLFLSEVENTQQNRELGELLEEVLLAGATQMNLESWQEMESRIRELFRANDIDLDKLQPLEVARRIREHRFADRWTDALELWIGTLGQMMSFPGGPKLTEEDLRPWAEAMYAADPNPLRTAIRKEIYTRSLNAKNLDAAVAEADLSEQSPRCLSWLATTYIACGAPEKCDEVFRLALETHPQDVMLNYDYAMSLSSQNRNQEAIRIYHRCVALRPDIGGFWGSLAELLEKEGEEEAAREARLRLEALQGQ